jgi:4-hydroxy-4-methyl-2-oxoglutarate aldolase
MTEDHDDRDQGVALLERAGRLSAASLHEAQDRTGALPPAIKPLNPAMRLAGPAFTLACPEGHNLNIHRAIPLARPGDILVIAADAGVRFGYWGDILSNAAKVRGLGGLLIDGGVRDADALERVGLPIFCRGLSIAGTGKAEGGSIGRALQIGEVTILPGDFIIGDRDGAVVVPGHDLARVVQLAEAREAKEAAIVERLWAGETTLAIYNLPQRKP